MSFTRNKITISIRSYSESFRIESNPANFDVFIRKKWCSKHKTAADCERNIVKIFHRNKKQTVRLLTSLDAEITVYAVKLKDE